MDVDSRVDGGRPAAGPEPALDREIAAASRLAERAAVLSLQLGGEPWSIELPPAGASAADRAALRAAAALYFAAEVEATLLIRAVEAFAGLVVSGGISADLGPAAPLLVDFWKRRRDRLTHGEREALFARLFGSPGGAELAEENPRNTSFERLLFGLAEAISRLEAHPTFGPGPVEPVRLQVAAKELASNLASRSAGIAAYAARETVSAIREAVAISQRREPQAALGARSAWDWVRAVSARFLGRTANVSAHVGRARSGMSMLAWLADASSSLDDPPSRLASSVGPGLVSAAIEWMQSTLDLDESAASAPDRER